MNIQKQHGLTFHHGMILGALSVMLSLVLMMLWARADMYGIIGVGRTQAHLSQGSSDGGIAWQQKGFEHHEDTRDTAWNLGLGYQFAPWIALESQYRNLGSVTAHGQWGFNDDGSSCGTTWTGNGGASVHGVTLAGIGRYHFTPAWSLGIEGGAFRWRSAWRETGYNTRGETFVHDPVKTEGVGAVTGLVLGYKALDMRLEMLHVEPRDSNFDAIKVLSLNWRF